MEERNVKISLKIAKKWYHSNDSTLVDLALQAFNMNELEEPKLPKSWEEFINHSSLYNGSITRYENKVAILNRLLLIRDVYRQGWKPSYTMGSGDKWEVTFFGGELTIECVSMYGGYFVFETKDIALNFLQNFKDELNEIKQLL